MYGNIFFWKALIISKFLGHGGRKVVAFIISL